MKTLHITCLLIAGTTIYKNQKQSFNSQVVSLNLMNISGPIILKTVKIQPLNMQVLKQV